MVFVFFLCVFFSLLSRLFSGNDFVFLDLEKLDVVRWSIDSPGVLLSLLQDG